MALPNINSVQQAGVDPLSIQQQQNRDQKIAEILDNVQSRLSNITNMRSNVQTATFEAFGNNFISRTMSQVMDSAMDSFKTLIVGKKEDKDPVLDNAKEQTRLLNHLISISNDSNKTLNLIDDSVINIRRDIKNIFDKSNNASKADESKPISPLTPNLSTPSIEAFPPIVPPDIFRRHSVPAIENNPSETIQFPLPPEHVIIGQPINNTPPPASVTEPFNQTQSKPVHEQHERHVEKVLDDILHVMTKTNQSIDDLLKVVPLSTKESETEKNQQSSTLSSRIKDLSQIEDAPPPGSNKFDWSRLITGWFDMDANIRGINNILKGIENAASKIGQILPKTLGSLIPSIGTIGAGLAASAPIAAMYGVTKWAESASITDDKGELTGTGKVLDAVQTSLGGQTLKPQTSIISNADRIAQEADTGFFDVFGTKKDAYRKKYQEQIDRQQSFNKDEADALKKYFDLTVPQKLINQNSDVNIEKQNIDRVKQLDDKSKELTKSAQANSTKDSVKVNNTSVVNNQTILPTRTSTKNTDDSYNRYMTRAMS